MPPGDPLGVGGPSQADHIPRREVLLKMDDHTDEDVLLEEILYWKEIADNLRVVHYPLYAPPEGDPDYDEFLNGRASQLFSFLDQLLGDVRDGVLETDAVYTKLRILTAQGQPFDKFKQQMVELDFSEKCNAIWENDAVAYRCNTCALTPCMSLCAPCFLAGNHDGHDFTRFFSREGGACDCGNADVLRSEGFCKRHDAERGAHRSIPSTVVSLPEHIICRAFNQDFLQESESQEEPLDMIDFSEKRVSQSSKLIGFLQEYVAIGGPLRDAVSRILLDQDLYCRLCARTSDEDIMQQGMFVDVSLDWRTLRFLEEDKLSLCDFAQLRAKFDLDPSLLKFNCLLDELIFWIIRLAFPQSLINLSLGMLSDDAYRDRFAFRFFAFYPCSVELVRQLCVLSRRREERARVRDDRDLRVLDVSQIACRIIHISVQMLSSEAMCLRLNDSVNLVNTVLASVFYLLSSHCRESRMSLAPLFRNMSDESRIEVVHSGWPVIDCDANPVFNNHGYWFVMGDLQNLLSHNEVALRVVSSRKAFNDCYIALIRRMQGVNQCFRIVAGEHREQDSPDAYQKSFTLEFETSAISMFNMVSAILSSSDLSAAAAFITGFKEALYGIDPFLEMIRTDIDFLKKIILHPLRIQVVRVEVQAGMWVRNGSQLRVQTAMYTQSHLATALLIPDMDLIRYCAANLPAEWVWECVLESFHLHDAFEWSTRQHKKVVVRNPGEETTDSTTNSGGESAATTVLKKDKLSPTSEMTEQSTSSLTSDGTSMETQSLQDSSAAEQTATPASRKIPDQAAAVPVFPSCPGSSNEAISETSSNFPPRTLFSEVHWKGPQDAEVLQRPDWIDPLMAGALRLIAQCAIIRGSFGCSYRDLIRDELVYALSENELTHSRLRSCVPEKGSRSIVGEEQLFEEVLHEVAEFREADANRQGTYKLKASAWRAYFCPLYLQMRCSMTKQWTAVLNRIEQMEREQLDSLKQSQSKLWIPYRLIPCDSFGTHPSIEGASRLLACDRFFEMSAIVITTASGSKWLHDQCVQLAVYLLSQSVVFADSLQEVHKEQVLQKFHRMWNYQWPDGVIRKVSAFTASVALLSEQLPNRMEFCSVLKKEFQSEVENRIIGTGVEYTSRLLNLLYKKHSTSREMLNTILAAKDGHITAPELVAEEAKKDERRRQARERMEALMAKTKKKNVETMQRLMAQEGVTQQQMDAIDTNQPTVRLYECPICGDSTPSTLQEPLGLLVKVCENDVVGQQVDIDEPELSLMEMDERTSCSHGTDSERNPQRWWYMARRELIDTVRPYSHMVECSTPIELKTCGHYAHISCFNAYRDTLRAGERDADISNRFEASCPLCRYKVNAQLPVTIDFGFQTSTGSIAVNLEEAREKLIAGVVWWKRSFQDASEEETFTRHYSRSLNTIISRGMAAAAMEEKEPSVHNYVASLIKTNVERNLLLDMLHVPERRKNTRTIVVEHLPAAVVARTSPTERTLLLCAIRDLLSPDYFPQTEASTFGFELGGGDYFQQVLPMDEDDLVNVGDIRESLGVLFDNRPLPKRSPRDCLAKKSDVPLLLYDIKGILVKLTCYIVEKSNLSCDEKMQLARVVAEACLRATQTRCALQLLLRLPMEAVGTMAGADGVSPLLSSVSRSLLECRPFIDPSCFSGTDEGASNFERTLTRNAELFMRFVAELWHETRLYPLPPGVSAAHAPPEILADIIGDHRILTPSFQVVNTWIHQIAPIVQFSRASMHKAFTREPLSYRPQLLLKLPDLYDDLFRRFFNRQCVNCSTVPLSPFICLLCSQMVCFGKCCRVPSLIVGREIATTEVERHAQQCGWGYCAFLVLNASVVVFIRRRAAIVWGTVYLDAHGEEDRNLRRGKPLFLSAHRWKALEHDWAEKDMSRAFSNWTHIEEMGNQLRNAHLFERR